MWSAFCKKFLRQHSKQRLQTLAAQAVSEGIDVRDKVALVLNDLEMSEMDGFTLTRNIKKAIRFKGIPVVIHASLSGETNEARVRSVGADAYIANVCGRKTG